MTDRSRHRPDDEASTDDQPRTIIEVIEANEEVFETIAEEVEDREAARKYGEQPLEILDESRERRGSE